MRGCDHTVGAVRLYVCMVSASILLCVGCKASTVNPQKNKNQSIKKPY